MIATGNSIVHVLLVVLCEVDSSELNGVVFSPEGGAVYVKCDVQYLRHMQVWSP